MTWLIAHLIGDYLLQNDWMALNKKGTLFPPRTPPFWRAFPADHPALLLDERDALPSPADMERVREALVDAQAFATSVGAMRYNKAADTVSANIKLKTAEALALITHAPRRGGKHKPGRRRSK